ncbi:hypothetical protein GCM10011371_30350 [Novosphingobium marinum]|uniref:Uncharacterized protein n=1 Tax=Novosphingobium marinum TaxID=1514948 RepID=A0A7Y9XV23_9SPHN|nr:hypothetical protein [Novosphingobium marinum]NYH95012.1 hypothetical protein [Novosphingobium marinum]GGC40856.1 hypothetical protein GCM10011371_30350 [Novosphingobium marinum]
MILRAASGWQTILADLSLILFMVTGAALGGPESIPARTQGVSERSEPLAFYESSEGAPPLSDWLAAQSPDPRQILTITTKYDEGGLEAALVDADRLSREAAAFPVPVRIVVEPGTGNISAVLSFDAPAGMAHALQDVAKAGRTAAATRKEAVP